MSLFNIFANLLNVLLMRAANATDRLRTLKRALRRPFVALYRFAPTQSAM